MTNLNTVFSASVSILNADLSLDVGASIAHAMKIESFGVRVEKCNGHDFAQIYSKLKKLHKFKGPVCLLANTVKGKGIKIMENKPNWHYWNNISEEIYNKSLTLLDNLYE